MQLATVRVWDLPTRLFHWTLVLFVLFAWISSEYFEELSDPRLQWHRWTGYGILTLLLWRVLWGIWGPPFCQFRNFIKGPKKIFAYTKDLLGGSSRNYLGHNPLGAVMILMMLLCLSIIAILGLFSVEENDLASGPLADLISEEGNKLATKFHRVLFNSLLIGLLILHIFANILYGFIRKDPLLKAMITGNKPKENYKDQAFIIHHRDFRYRAILFLAASLLIVAFVVLIPEM